MNPTPHNPENPPPSLSELYVDVLNLARVLNVAEELGEVPKVRESISEEIHRAETHVRKAGYSDLVERARFAIIALLDEMLVRNGNWRHRHVHLENPLQWEHYRTRNAGEEFFERLDQLRQRPDENRALIEVYFHCLAVGFEGKFFDASERERYVVALSKEIARGQQWAVDELSPHWHRPPEPPLGPPSKVRMWFPIGVTLLIGILLIVLFREMAVRRAAEVWLGP